MGTLTAPSISVLMLRDRQSQGAIKAPLQEPSFRIAGNPFISIVFVGVARKRECPAASYEPAIEVGAVSLTRGKGTTVCRGQ